jgi:hypothetical protein
VREERDALKRNEDSPQVVAGRDDPAWPAAHARLMAELRRWRGDGNRVGKITKEDKYGPFPACAGPGGDPAPE